MNYYSNEPLRTILFCEEMEGRNTPAVIAPAVAPPPSDGGTMPAATAAPPVQTPAAQTTAPAPSVNAPFGSFALPQNAIALASTAFVALPDLEGGFSFLGGAGGGSVLVSTFASDAAGLAGVFSGINVNAPSGNSINALLGQADTSTLTGTTAALPATPAIAGSPSATAGN